jgi:DNA-binding MarR family transcriptional regulator
MTDTKEQAALKIARVLQELCLSDNRGASARSAIAFLTIAARPGLTVGQIQKVLGYTPVATSRSLSVMYPKARGRVGLGIVEARPDPNDLRLRRLHLTDEGEKLWQRASQYI